MTGHALVVGGTGMLAGAVRGLVQGGWRVSVLARRASAFAMREPGVVGLDCNYNDTDALVATLNRARDGEGAIDLAVGWFHTLGPAPMLATRTGCLGTPGRFFHVLGSAMADPEHPERLARAAHAADGAVHCFYRQVVLGFVLEGEGARWLTNDEISAGVLKAIDVDAAVSAIGVTRPWSARPSA
jgi:NAD(P)-dependent dehydrogenase (short-subunit alcohol dehydrogenase family)